MNDEGTVVIDDLVLVGVEEQNMCDERDLDGAVVVGVVPGQSPRVLESAARAAVLLDTPLVVVNVDTSRSVWPDPTEGYGNNIRPEIAAVGRRGFDAVRREALAQLANTGVRWKACQLIGDPAFALTHFADRTEAPLIVVGTRRHGIGAAARELLTGSVAARLSHLQSRPLLVVPQDR